jgi:hypothetical protein
MAEAVLSDIAASVIKSLGSLALEEIGLLWGFEDELKKLGNTVSTIQAVLLDAEEQQAKSHLVKDKKVQHVLTISFHFLGRNPRIGR